MDQLGLFETLPRAQRRPDVIHDAAESPVLSSYDVVVLAFSGGKDSVACALHLIEQGVRPELWHHDIDGRAGAFFDWPITPAYCDAFAAAFDLPIYHSWRVGGLRGELLKENDRLKPTAFETPDGLRTAGGLRGKISTRRRWPALSADLARRWCSSVSKIDVMAAAIANQERFRDKRVLVVTGERSQESSARSRYASFEPHRSHAPGRVARRHVDHWRPVHGWSEEQVWTIMERHRVDAHPCYHLGWGRASCLTCIFGSKDQWASIRLIVPDRFAELERLEDDFGFTLRKGVTLGQLADQGTPYPMDEAMVRLALSTTYDRPVVVDPWRLPLGAYGENAGPT